MKVKEKEKLKMKFDKDQTNKQRKMNRLGLDQWIVNICAEMGIREPTDIQTEAIPRILAGKNVCGRAETGSGKTAAFALPILHKLSQDPFGIYAVVLTPARELAIQIAEQFQVFGAGCNIQVCTVIGGMDMIQQSVEMSKRPHIIVATPGRLADLVGSGTEFGTKFLEFVVLDEADRLFQPEFQEDLETIFSKLPAPDKRQTLLFSATLSVSEISSSESSESSEFGTVNTEKKVDPAAVQIMQNLPSAFSGISFENVIVSSSAFQTVDSVKQSYIFMPEQTKYSYLVHILREQLEENPNSSIILFVGSVVECELLSETLTELSVRNVGLYSKLSQTRRLASLGKFKGGLVKLLVATDVASRGLDIKSVDLVINFDVPRNAVDYVHRIGRTARAGKMGKAITCVSQREINMYLAIEEAIGRKLDKEDISDDSVLALMKEVEPAKRMARIRLGDFDRKRKRRKV